MVGFWRLWHHPSMVWHSTDIDPVRSGPAVWKHGDLEVIVTRVDSEWLAAENRCTHAGCSFTDDGEVDGAVLICNCHGSEFDMRTGTVLVPPARTRLQTFPIRVTEGTVQVDLP